MFDSYFCIPLGVCSRYPIQSRMSELETRLPETPSNIVGRFFYHVTLICMLFTSQVNGNYNLTLAPNSSTAVSYTHLDVYKRQHFF